MHSASKGIIKDFFYISVLSVALFCGYMSLPNRFLTLDLSPIKYIHSSEINTYVSEKYYIAAEKYLYAYDKDASTKALITAIEFDPYPFSDRFREFKKRQETFFSDEKNYEEYFKKEP